jgi:hypothetical protein
MEKIVKPNPHFCPMGNAGCEIVDETSIPTGNTFTERAGALSRKQIENIIAN